MRKIKLRYSRVFFLLIFFSLNSCDQDLGKNTRLNNYRSSVIDSLISLNKNANYFRTNKIKCIKKYSLMKSGIYFDTCNVEITSFKRNGFIIKKEKFDFGVIENQKFYKYDKKNRLVEEIEKIYLNNRAPRVYLTSYEYDNFNKLIEMKIICSDNEQTSLTKFEYDNFGNLYKIINKGTIDVFKWEENNCIEKLFLAKKGSFNEFDTIFIDRYQYNEKGKLIKEENIYSINQIKMLKYDDFGNAISKKITDLKGNIITIENYIIKYYDNYYIIIDSSESSKNVYPNRIIKKYDYKNRCLLYTSWKDDTLLQSNENIYDENNLIKKIDFYRYNNNKDTINVISMYRYDKYNNVIEKIEQLNGRISFYMAKFNQHNLIIEEDFDKEGKSKNMYIYSYY